MSTGIHRACRRTITAAPRSGNRPSAPYKAPGRRLRHAAGKQLACTLWLLMAAAAPVAGQADAAASAVDPKQFNITLPDGWSVYDQTAAITGSRRPLGILIFSSQPLLARDEQTPAPEMLARVDTGALPSFFVDRQAATKGMSCAKFTTSAAYNLGVKLAGDTIFGAARSLLKALPVKHEKITLGGCQGFRYYARGKKGEWILDVRAVSDATVLYLFGLRNRAEHYPANSEVFDQALNSLVFATP